MKDQKPLSWFYKFTLLSGGIVCAFLVFESLLVVPNVIDFQNKMHYPLWTSVFLSFVVPAVILAPLCILDFVIFARDIRNHIFNGKNMKIILIANVLVIVFVLYIINSPTFWFNLDNY